MFGSKVPTVSATISQGSGGFRCELILQDAKAPHFVTTLEIPRGWAEQVVLGAPSAFTVQPLPVTGMDPDWVDEWNRRTLRLVGCMELVPRVPARLFFPARLLLVPDLVINGQFQDRREAGAAIGYFRATHAEFGGTG